MIDYQLALQALVELDNNRQVLLQVDTEAEAEEYARLLSSRQKTFRLFTVAQLQEAQRWLDAQRSKPLAALVFKEKTPGLVLPERKA